MSREGQGPIKHGGRGQGQGQGQIAGWAGPMHREGPTSMVGGANRQEGAGARAGWAGRWAGWAG